jgi:magnesium chelatase family protein
MIRVLSLNEEFGDLTTVEVEISLWPGLPDIQFIGRADPHLKESAKRIKSAIKACGFEFPINQQVLVNLRPSYQKKSSRGLDLPVALGFLMATGQIPQFLADENLLIYGELSLIGEVHAPAGIGHLITSPQVRLITGRSEEPIYCHHQRLGSLQEFKGLNFSPPEELKLNWAPDSEVLDLVISEKEARLAKAIAWGGHSVLLAGPSGSGKTTFAKVLHALMPRPIDRTEQLKIMQTLSPQEYRYERVWRPLVRPHHTIPLHSLIGGGTQAHGGEISRAHRGMLLLDEFFEFSSLAMEALREPLEEKKLRVARIGKIKEYDLDMQAVATTNLCPCGDYVPFKGATRFCRYTLARCRSYSQKITGPLLDRFEFLIFTENSTLKSKKNEGVQVRQIAKELENLRLLHQRQDIDEGTNSKLAVLINKEDGRERVPHPPKSPDLSELLRSLDPLTREMEFDRRTGSKRRKEALLRAAHSFAQIDGEQKILNRHLLEAETYTLHHFEKLKKWEI